MSYINSHVSAVMVFFFFFLDKLVKQRSTGSSPKSAPLTWVDVLSLPLSANQDPPKKDESQHRSVAITVYPQFFILVRAANTVSENWSEVQSQGKILN